jgi:adenine-specific DNA methylase
MDTEAIQRFTRRSQIRRSFGSLLNRFQYSIVVVSYHSYVTPSRDEILGILRDLGKRTRIVETPHRHVLGRKPSAELLFIAP